MTALKPIHLEQADGVARIRLDRPKHNVLNIAMMKELSAALEKLAEDRDLKCIAVYGEGQSWCAGVDVGEHKPETVGEMIPAFNHIFEILNNMEI